ncbi:hypothetical protein GCM10022225_05650 [Plantactinospora mayteni]|uniref:Glycosyltransferase RgtA/B/C/D-like domain-containing protein n=1 Tax=Plantactinospora mayteni TaxID=566021 RepID=A0ABQ4ER13_9ACTN|nr:hypothetical protein [Plantactinospora mayteni]GIG97054.1 hypothetical protein Pma05_36270 [Plantactinospora mayteni]
MAHGVVIGPVWPADGSPEPDDRRPRRPRWLGGSPAGLGALTFGLTQAVLLFWWAARYPGLFSPDSLDHVWQATTGNWNTHHPVSYTGLVWLSIRLTGGIGALTLVQTTALAAGLAYAVTGLRRIGGPAWAWVTAAVVVVALPPVGIFTVCVWKDVPFVVCHVFLLGTVARLLAARRLFAVGRLRATGRMRATDRMFTGRGPDATGARTTEATGARAAAPGRGPESGWPSREDLGAIVRHAAPARWAARLPAGNARRMPWGLLGVLVAELTLACLFRQNGFVVVAIVTVLLAVLLRGVALRILLAGVVAATVALLTNWSLLPALGVRDSESIVAYEAFLADLAIGYAEQPADFPAADLALMTKVAPLVHWRQSADCYTVDSTVYHPDFDRQVAAEHHDELLSAWWRLVRRSPGTVLSARVCRGSIAWRPTPAGGLRANPTAWALPIYLERDPRFQREEVLAVAYSRPLSERVSDVADVLASRVGQPEWLLWRGATWAYLAYLTVGLLAWRRRDRALLALATLSLGNQLSVLAVNNAQAARYMAAPFVLGVLLLPLLAARDPEQTGPEGRDANRGWWTGGSAGAGEEPPLRVTDLTVVAEPGLADPADPDHQLDPAHQLETTDQLDPSDRPDPAYPLGPADRRETRRRRDWTEQVDAADESGLRAPPIGPAEWWTDPADRSR